MMPSFGQNSVHRTPQKIELPRPQTRGVLHSPAPTVKSIHIVLIEGPQSTAGSGLQRGGREVRVSSIATMA